MALPVRRLSCSSVLSCGTGIAPSISNTGSTKTRGFLRCNGASLRAIMSKNLRGMPGFGYSSMSQASKKCVMAASRAMFRPTLTG